MKKIISIALIFSMILNIPAFADDISIIEQLGPAAIAESEKKELPAGTILHDSPIAGSIIDSNTANIISQVNIVGEGTNRLGVSPSAAAGMTLNPSGNLTNTNNPTNLITNPIQADLVNPYGTGNIPENNANTYLLPTALSLTNLVVKNTAAAKPTNINAPSYALINVTTNQIYDVKGQNEKYNPSGLANLMTAYVAASNMSMDATLTVNSSAVYNIEKDASIIALSNKDKITLKDAIAAMFVKGAVDAANVIAENVAASKSDFVNLMNTTAANMGLQNTHFTDPAGILAGNETTALEMAIIMAKVCERPELVELLSLSSYTLPAVSRREQLIIYNKNTQLTRDSGSFNSDVIASRMSFTSNSKYCIASLMNYNNNRIVAVVLKAEGSQFSDTRKLLEFAKVAANEQ